MYKRQNACSIDKCEYDEHLNILCINIPVPVLLRELIILKHRTYVVTLREATVGLEWIKDKRRVLHLPCTIHSEI